jgi:cell pole-organizing protein PopZ
MNDTTYYLEEKEKIKRFRCEMGDEIDEATWRAMDDVQKIVESIMPQIKEIIRKETASLKAFVDSAPFDDPYLKEDLYKSLDALPSTAETFIVAGIRRTVRKAFEVLKDDVNEKTSMALEGLDLLIVPDR